MRQANLPSIPPASNPATANALGLVKAGAGLLAAVDGTLSVDSAAPTALFGPPLGTDQVVIVRGTQTYYVPVSALTGGTAPATATSYTIMSRGVFRHQGVAGWLEMLITWSTSCRSNEFALVLAE